MLLDPHEGNKVKPVKGTLLYGRNGAGKSTLAKAVRKAKGESQDTISQAEFLSINNLPIELTEEESVQKVLSKTVEEHLAELRTVMAEEIEIDFSPFSKLEMSTNSCLEILAQINMGIRNNNLLIQSRFKRR